MSINFLKMHGLGNDFVILDTRNQQVSLSPTAVQKICNRHLGVGCDQLIVLSLPDHDRAMVKMGIFNADGGQAEACGNASRCVAWILAQEGLQSATLETMAGLLHTKVTGHKTVQVNMGPARFDWQQIPLRAPLDASTLALTFQTLIDPVIVNVGNPHVVFFVKSFADVNLERLGASLSRHPLFVEGTNVEIAQVQDFHTLKVQVWERGVGRTLACGSGACAAGVAAFNKGLTGKKVCVELEGGHLEIETLSNGDVLMTGPVEQVYEGKFEIDLIS